MSTVRLGKDGHDALAIERYHRGTEPGTNPRARRCYGELLAPPPAIAAMGREEKIMPLRNRCAIAGSRNATKHRLVRFRGPHGLDHTERSRPV